MSKKHKKTRATLNYVEHLVILTFVIASCVSISVFGSLLDVSIGITSSAGGLRICLVTAGIKRYKSTIKKKKKKHNKLVLLAKTKLNAMEVLISKALIDSYISHKKFTSINNVLRKYYEMKEEIKNPKSAVKFIL